MYHARHDHARVFGSLVLMLGIVVALGLGAVVTTIGLRGFLGSRVVSNRLSLQLLTTLIVLVPVEALNLLLHSVFAAFAEARFIFFRRHVAGPSLRLIAILAVMAADGDVTLLAAVYVITGIVGLGIGFTLVSRVFKKAGLRVSGFKVSAREILAYGFPMMASDVALMLKTNAVVQMLEFFRGSTSVADFRAVVPLARLNRAVLDSFGFLFIPTMTRLLVRGDSRGVNLLFWRSTLWVMILTFPVFLGTFALAGPVTVLLFGPRYADSALILAVLSLGMFFSAALGLNQLALKAAGRVRQVLWIDGVTIGLLLTLNVLLIPRHGALGGAVSYLATTLVNTLLYQAALFRTMGIKLFPREYAKVYIVVGLVVLAVLSIQMAWSPPIYIGLLLAGLSLLPVLAVGGRLLAAEETFPELLRIPLLSRLVHAVGGTRPGRPGRLHD